MYSRSGFSYIDISSRTPHCIYNDHILHCGLINSNSRVYKLYSIKNKGGITWTNLREQYIDIPKNHTLNFKIAYGLFYTDKWYFFVNFTNAQGIINFEIFTIFILDIIHNGEETTAKCEIIISV